MKLLVFKAICTLKVLLEIFDIYQWLKYKLFLG